MAAKTISPEDLRLLILTDSPDEAMEHIASCASPAVRASGVHKWPAMTILGEAGGPKTRVVAGAGP